MPDHLHLLTDCPKSSAETFLTSGGQAVANVAQYAEAQSFRPVRRPGSSILLPHIVHKRPLTTRIHIDTSRF